MQLFNLFRTSRGLFHLFIYFFSFLFIIYTRHLRLSVPGDFAVLVYCVILYINIYIKTSGLCDYSDAYIAVKGTTTVKTRRNRAIDGYNKI